MSGTPDCDRAPLRPFLINKDDEGSYRLTIRETRYNSQGYPIVTAKQIGQVFRTTAEARAFAADQFGGEAGQFSST